MGMVGVDMDGSLNSYMQLIGTLNLRQQLINANLNPDAKANFNDWEKLVNSNELPTLKGLYAILTANGAIMKFQEYNGGAPGLEEGHKISFNMNLIQNVLKYAYTIGHEMYHTFVGDNKSIYDNFVNQSTTVTSQGFQLFKEFASYSLEITWGNDRIGNPWSYVVDNYGPNSTKIPENRRYKQNVIDFIKPIRSDLNILYYNAYQKALKRLQQ